MVQWAYEIAGEIASDAVKAMALAMSLTKSFDAYILEQVIALKAQYAFPRRTKIAPPIYSAELLCQKSTTV